MNTVAMVTWHILAPTSCLKNSFPDLLTALTLKVNYTHCSNPVSNNILIITIVIKLSTLYNVQPTKILKL